jgi:NAD(P)-dependent dehydrogenase (short-subunit alcohol dehydrogenase family)
MLEGKVAIVTGASAGIGRAYALALAAEGATVVAAARRLNNISSDSADPNTLSDLVTEAASLRGRVYAHACDMESERDVINLIEHTAINFDRIDILVNNAAALWQIEALNIEADIWDRMMITNVRGPYVAIRQAARHMKKQNTGSVINITAGAGNFSPKSNHPKMLAYAVSKAALNRLSYFMAAELKPFGIAVNCLSPGVVASEAALKANPNVAGAGTHKPATPEVLGPALIYLAQQNAETLTGEILHTDEFQKTWPKPV